MEKAIITEKPKNYTSGPQEIVGTREKITEFADFLRNALSSAKLSVGESWDESGHNFNWWSVGPIGLRGMFETEYFTVVPTNEGVGLKSDPDASAGRKKEIEEAVSKIEKALEKKKSEYPFSVIRTHENTKRR